MYVKTCHTMLPIVVAVLVAIPMVHARLIDISKEIQTVVSVHNDERTHPDLHAANMREMVWNSQLQRQAEEWASLCVYERPANHMGVGANLHYQRTWVRGHAAAHKLVKHSLNAWIKEKSKYVYSSHCGAACLYVQMIHSKSDRVGCAMNTCQDMKARLNIRVRGTLFVCLYSPQSLLKNTFPYVKGPACSQCARDETCIGGHLCSSDERLGQLVLIPPERTRKTPDPVRPQRDNAMTKSEMMSMLEVHNKLRRDKGLAQLVWDEYLERFCKYVINCTVDYPGPRHAYTNFQRVRYNNLITNAVYDWVRDADVIPPNPNHKCRAPFDIEDCSHYTNMMQPDVTGMACSTKNCGRSARQMVCIYDNRQDRDYSRRNRVRKPRRRLRLRSREGDSGRSRSNQALVSMITQWKGDRRGIKSNNGQ